MLEMWVISQDDGWDTDGSGILIMDMVEVDKSSHTPLAEHLPKCLASEGNHHNIQQLVIQQQPPGLLVISPNSTLMMLK